MGLYRLLRPLLLRTDAEWMHGGVFSAEDAYRKIRLGASLVQLMTALVYEGPGIAKRITENLSQLAERDGFGNIAEAVGIDT